MSNKINDGFTYLSTCNSKEKPVRSLRRNLFVLKTSIKKSLKNKELHVRALILVIIF